MMHCIRKSIYDSPLTKTFCRFCSTQKMYFPEHRYDAYIWNTDMKHEIKN